jgi:hypothetical protein
MRFGRTTSWALGLLVATAGTGETHAQDATGLRSSLPTEGIYTLSSPVPIAPPSRPLQRPAQRNERTDDALSDTPDTERRDNDDLEQEDADAQDRDQETDTAQDTPAAQPFTGLTTTDDQAVQPVPQQPQQRQVDDKPFEPLGVRAGAFLLFPSLEIGGVYTDNVAQVAHDPQDDIGLRLVPALRVQSDWVRHEFNFNGSGDLIFYADNNNFDHTTATVNGTLRLDVRSTTTAQIDADYLLTETSSSDSEVPDAAIGRRVEHSTGGSLALTHNWNRLSATLTSGARYRMFEDVELAGGGVEDNSDRNYIEPSVALRVGYDTSPAIQPFVEVGYQPRIHDETVDRAGLRRSSHGGFARIGVALNPSPIWAGNVAVRYDVRDFDDASLETIHSLGLDADLTWRPSALTSIVWTATTGIDESAQAGVSGSRRHEGTVAVSHALRENLILGATAGIEFTDFVGSSQEELELTGGLSVSYIIRRELELLAGYTITGFESTVPGADYIENQVTAGFRFRL